MGDHLLPLLFRQLREGRQLRALNGKSPKSAPEIDSDGRERGNGKLARLFVEIGPLHFRNGIGIGIEFLPEIGIGFGQPFDPLFQRRLLTLISIECVAVDTETPISLRLCPLSSQPALERLAPFRRRHPLAADPLAAAL